MVRQDDLERWAALRHVEGGRHFVGGPDFGAGPAFGGGRGRKRRGDVRAALLLAITEEPSNGYQLMQTIEERSGGRWRPSPGSVYPSLAQLEDEGLIRAVDRDGSRVFEITQSGRERLRTRAETAAPWDAGEDPAANSFSELRSLVVQVVKAASQVAHVGGPPQTARACEVLTETRRSLYRILAEDADA